MSVKMDVLGSIFSGKMVFENGKCRTAEFNPVISLMMGKSSICEEENKSGILACDVEAFCDSVSEFENIRLRGFMTMAPKCEKKEDYIKYFSQIYKIALDILAKKRHNIYSPVISMGMSESFEEAIECGSDIVRVGRSLFVK